jgi:hypothetical protein
MAVSFMPMRGRIHDRNTALATIESANGANAAKSTSRAE